MLSLLATRPSPLLCRGRVLGVRPQAPCLELVRSLAKKANKKSKAKRTGGGSSSAPSKGSSGGGGGGGGGQDVVTMFEVRKALPGGRVLLDGVSLRLLQGAKVGVLGANGAGKSTLLKLLCGMDEDYEGRVERRGNVSFGMMAQEPQLDEESNVLSNVTDGLAEQKAALTRFDEVNDLLASGAVADGEMDALLAEQSALTDRIEALDCWGLSGDVAAAMAALNCPPGDAMPSTLSGGQRRRVALARLLLSKPDVLLLDEPTNHLDATSVAWLETYLSRYKGAVVAVTHDRYFLDNVAGWILEVDRGRCVPFRGNYTEWLTDKAQRMRQEETEEKASAQRMRDELKWIQDQQRRGKGKDKAKVRNYEKLVQEREGSRDNDRLVSGAIAIAPGPRLGSQVLAARGLALSHGGRELFRDLSFELPAGAIMGIVGANGTGKTSLLRLIAGETTPDAGELALGPSVALGYASQTRDGLDPAKTVFEEISQGLETITMGGQEVSLRLYVAAFNLRGQMQEKRVGSLSGGERGRVHLAKTLRAGCNLLLLDEPSNDLDVDTLRSLEEALSDFAGSAIVVSHDRWFLDRVCTHTLAFEPDGKVEFFEGSLTQYQTWRARTGKASQV
jgi:sulfate-transporting ATPase